MKYNSATNLRSITPIRRAFVALSIILALATTFTAFGLSVDTSWTYQGQLRRSGAAYTGTCNFQFSLWNTSAGGNQLGNTLSRNSVGVANGLFTVLLDFGDLFKGDAPWLATSVQCSGDSGFTPLDPRQALTAAPYALSLRPGAQINGAAEFQAMLAANNASNGFGITASGKVGLYGSTTGGDGIGVYGHGGTGANSAGVFGQNANSAAIWGRSTGMGSAIFGENTGSGLAGRFVGPVSIAGPVTVAGSVTTGPLFATNTASTGAGVDGRSFTGVYGKTTASNGSGVFGEADTVGSAGVFGLNREGDAVWGRSTGSGTAVYGEAKGSGPAGFFEGTTVVHGNLTVTGNVLKGAGNFRIDHPLDPEHKFLLHSFVESPDMMNIYNGNVTTDATGSATVTLPPYFAALNRDYRYQLTVLGQFAQAIVSREIIADNTFAIRTDKPGVKVSWQVTGIRQDAYAKGNPTVVEQAKSAEEDGKYLYPAGFGAGEEKQIGRSSRLGSGPVAPDRSGAVKENQAEDK